MCKHASRSVSGELRLQPTFDFADITESSDRETIKFAVKCIGNRFALGVRVNSLNYRRKYSRKQLQTFACIMFNANVRTDRWKFCRCLADHWNTKFCPGDRGLFTSSIRIAQKFWWFVWNLRWAFEFAYGDELEDAIFEVIKSVMVLVQRILK